MPDGPVVAALHAGALHSLMVGKSTMISNRASIRLSCATIALSVGVFFSTGNLRAGMIDAGHLPTIEMQVQGAPEIWDYSPPVDAYVPATDNGGGYKLSQVLNAYGVCGNRANVRVQELQFNSDPFVLNNILVTNTTAVTQIYSVTVGLPTAFGAPNIISGNVRTSVIDGGLDGATIASIVGQPVYLSQIDFNPVQALQNDPFSVVAPAGGSNTAAASFGPSLSGIPVTSNIGIQLRFSLTAGDTASILSRFDVNQVPEPTGLVCCGLMVAYVSGFGRRHSFRSN
jgi:hypothetical protein